jgi:cytochrome c556
MNDDFLYRLRVDPSPEFAARLKVRLDAQSSGMRRISRWGMPMLIFGTAFALALPQVRDAIVQLLTRAPPTSATHPMNSPASVVESPLDPVIVTVPRLASAELRAAVREMLRESRPEASVPAAAGPLLRDDVLARRMARLQKLIADAPALSARRADEAVPHSSTMQDEAFAAVELRRSLFQVMARTVEPLIKMVRSGQAFDPAITGTSAIRLQQLAPMIREMFEHDTRGFVLPTQALDRIWTDKPNFNAVVDELSDAADGLATASRANDLSAAALSMRRVFESCEGCHEDYRRDDRTAP